MRAALAWTQPDFSIASMKRSRSGIRPRLMAPAPADAGAGSVAGWLGEVPAFAAPLAGVRGNTGSETAGRSRGGAISEWPLHSIADRHSFRRQAKSSITIDGPCASVAVR